MHSFHAHLLWGGVERQEEWDKTPAGEELWCLWWKKLAWVRREAIASGGNGGLEVSGLGGKRDLNNSRDQWHRSATPLGIKIWWDHLYAAFLGRCFPNFILTKVPAFIVSVDCATSNHPGPKASRQHLPLLDLQSSPHRLYLLVCLVFTNPPLPLCQHRPGSNLVSSLVSSPPILSRQTDSCSIHIKPTSL